MATKKIGLRPTNSLPGPQTKGCRSHQGTIPSKCRQTLTPNKYPRKKNVVVGYDFSAVTLNSSLIFCEADAGADDAKVLG